MRYYVFSKHPIYKVDEFFLTKEESDTFVENFKRVYPDVDLFSTTPVAE